MFVVSVYSWCCGINAEVGPFETEQEAEDAAYRLESMGVGYVSVEPLVSVDQISTSVFCSLHSGADFRTDA